MTEKSIRLLKKAGMFRCMFAIDTASDRLQKLTGRRLKIEKTLEAIRLARKHGIMVHGSFMIGFPTETKQEGQATIDLAVDSELHTAAFHRAMPFRGTEFYRMAEESGVEFPAHEGYDWQIDSTINASAMSDEDLFRLRQKGYRKFYLSIRRIAAIVVAMPNRWRLLPMLFAIWVKKAFVW